MSTECCFGMPILEMNFPLDKLWPSPPINGHLLTEMEQMQSGAASLGPQLGLASGAGKHMLHSLAVTRPSAAVKARKQQLKWQGQH